MKKSKTIVKSKRSDNLRNAAFKVKTETRPVKPYAFDIKPPILMPNVVPEGVKAPVMAMDLNPYDYANQLYLGGGFPGFPYLSQLATRAEYRAFASALSTELFREWIEFTTKEDDDTGTADKIKQIEEEFKRLKVRSVIGLVAQHDCFFGRGQIAVTIKGQRKDLPLVLDPRTVKVGSLDSIAAVEPIWTTPSAYETLDPTAVDFYKPTSWYMLGKKIHASRLLTIITRPLPDILKPAFNFGGMSLSQLAEPYVDNWLRTRQSVADMINIFSITALKTDMAAMLGGEEDPTAGQDLMNRAELFSTMRSNKGLAVLDMEHEDLVQINTPLSGLHELQAQSQEQMCSVSRMPAIILTGISPGGLNASSDSEIRAFYDWIAAQQEAYYREPIETLLKLVQLNLFGEIDPDIGVEFVPLYQMTPKELAEIRKSDCDADVAYVNAGVLDPQEIRERLATDPTSGYMGLDTTAEIVPPNNPANEDDPFGNSDPNAEGEQGEEKPDAKNPFAASDADFKEEDHPRAPNGQFGSGSGSSNKSFKNGGKDDKGYERAPGLSSKERGLEQKFYDRIHGDTDGLVNEYHGTNGNVIDPDLVKGLDPDFKNDPGLARAVHEPSSHLAKVIYQRALDKKAAEGDTSPTLFSAGGGGSGKSTTKPIAEAALGADPNGLFYDSTLSSFKSAKSRIDAALNTTVGDVGIAYTNTPLSTALKLNALRGRSVSIDTLLHAHVGASDTIRELAEHYADNPRVKIAVVNNDLGKRATAGDVSDVPKYDPFNVREQLVAQAKGLLAGGEIDQKKYDILVK